MSKTNDTSYDAVVKSARELTEAELYLASGGKGGDGGPKVYLEFKLKEVLISGAVTSPTNPT